MSRSLNRLRRTAREPETDMVPVVLPHVVITVTETGELTATVDGEPFDPPPNGIWTRGTFGELLDAITHDRTITVRVEVHESDGTVFTDLIHAQRRPTPQPVEEPAQPTGKHADRKPRERVEVIGDGFAPGEDVAVALVVSHTKATDTGQARTDVDRKDARVAVEVVLIGRSSGTIRVRRLP